MDGGPPIHYNDIVNASAGAEVECCKIECRILHMFGQQLEKRKCWIHMHSVLFVFSIMCRVIQTCTAGPQKLISSVHTHTQTTILWLYLESWLGQTHARRHCLHDPTPRGADTCLSILHKRWEYVRLFVSVCVCEWDVSRHIIVSQILCAGAPLRRIFVGNLFLFNITHSRGTRSLRLIRAYAPCTCA